MAKTLRLENGGISSHHEHFKHTSQIYDQMQTSYAFAGELFSFKEQLLLLLTANKFIPECH